MSFLYLWKAASLPLDAAEQRFAAAIQRQSHAYETAFGRTFTARTHQIENLFVGQIELAAGVAPWQPWVASEDYGVAWGGVCETMLGRQQHAEALSSLVRTLFHDAKQVADWSGRFVACAWDAPARRVTLATSAENSPSLWQTEGRYGWAVGSHALPLLELVGRRSTLDLAAASLFVGIGYLGGQGALLEHVRRVGPRQQILLVPEQVSVRTYISLPEYAGLGQRPRKWNEVIHEQAEHMVGRVRREAAHSPQPQLLLTGGRDSRCIAAAAVAGGVELCSRTSGASNSADVRIARQVANALHLPHTYDGEHQSCSPIRAMLDAPCRLDNWVTLTEGTSTIRHALAFPNFFAGVAPFPAQQSQLFHGLHGLGGDWLRSYMPNVPGAGADDPIQRSSAFAYITARIPQHLRARDAAVGALNETLRHVDDQIGPGRISLAQWFNVYYWHSRALHWGADDMAIKDVIAWHWAPMLDGPLTRARLHTTGHSSRQLVEAITLQIAPALRGLSYDKPPASSVTQLKKGVKWAVKQGRRYGVPIPRRTAAAKVNLPVDPDLLQFWEQTFFGTRRAIWPELLDEAFVRDTICTQPSAGILWNLATVERMAQTIL